MNQKIFTYYMPVKVFFGIGELEKVGSLTKELGDKALLVTGKKSMKKLGITDKVIKLLKDNSVEVAVFEGVPSNPTDKVVDEGAEVAVREKVKVIIGLGGGSSLDVAKGISVVATQGGTLWDYIGENKVKGEIIPLMAIPTTAGTGSETTPYSVFTKQEIKRKDGLVSPHTYPKIGIVDPALMKSMPPELTADTGFDALAHAVEAYLSPLSYPLSDALAFGAVKLIGESLVKSVKKGDDLEARSKMALASSMAGMAIAQAGVIAGHAFGMTIGGILNTSHGRTVGILLPHVMTYSLPEIPEKIAGLAGALNVSVVGDPAKDAQRVIEAIKEMMEEVNFPTRLGVLGVNKENLPQILEDSMTQEDISNNPRKFDRESAREFLESII